MGNWTNAVPASWLLLLAAGFVLAGHPAEPAPSEAATAETDTAAARDVLYRFFREPDEAARRTLAEQFGAVAPSDWSAVRRMLHETAPRDPLAPGTHEFTTPGDAAVPPVHYVLRVPDGYDPKAPAGLPLIVTCHGAGGKGANALRRIERLLGPDVDSYLVAGPDSPQPGVYRVDRTTIAYPLHVLADVRRRANVNCDRTILTGYSRGGYTTWGTVLFSPTHWAGAMPMASWPLTEAGSDGAIVFLQNVLTLCIQAHWGEKDIVSGQSRGISTLSREAAAWFKGQSTAHFEGIEYPGQGHGLKLDEARIRTFSAEARRDPFPAECKYLFHHLYQGRASCVRVTDLAKEEFDFQKRRVLRIQRREDLPNAKRALWRGQGFEVTVRMPKGQNLIAVMARNLREIQVDLPAERLDFAKPIRITINHRTRFGKLVPVDWACLLETARETYDFERLVGGRVTTATGR